MVDGGRVKRDHAAAGNGHDSHETVPSITAGVLLVLVSTCIFGSIPALVVVSGDTIPPLTLLTWRSVVAVVVLSGVILILRRPRTRTPAEHKGQARRAFLLGLLVLGPDTVVYYLSFSYIDTGVAVAMSYIYPTFIVLGLAAYRRARPSQSDLLLGLVALAGVTLLSLPVSDGPVSVLGVALVLVTACGYALYVVLAGGLSRHMAPLRMSLWVIAGSTLAAVGPALVREGTSFPVGLGAWALVGGQALLLVTALATFYAGLRRLGPARSALMDTGQPLVAAVAGGLLLGERLVAVQVIGILLIVSSVAAAALLALRSAHGV